MAKKTGVILALGVGGLLLAAVARAQEKKPETVPPSPSQPTVPPPEIGTVTVEKCVRTKPGDGKKNKRTAEVKAWQKCLIASGCLPAGSDDGDHGPLTEAASKKYEASNGKCASPATVAVAPETGSATYSLDRQYTLDGEPRAENAIRTAAGEVPQDEESVKQFLISAAEAHYAADPVQRAGEYTIRRQLKGKTSSIWSAVKGNPQIVTPGGAGGGGGGGDLIA